MSTPPPRPHEGETCNIPTMAMDMTVMGESHPSVSDRIAKAEKVAYLYVAPIILAVGLFGSAANLLVLSNKRRFDGRLYVYLRVREIEWELLAQLMQDNTYSTVHTVYKAHMPSQRMKEQLPTQMGDFVRCGRGTTKFHLLLGTSRCRLHVLGFRLSWFDGQVGSTDRLVGG